MSIKKIFLSFTILFTAVITTACINNFAVQELNNKAKEYLANGDVNNAICRLKSSLDLDSSIFETNYNLAIAYISAENFEEAEKLLTKAIQIKPDFADSYYSLALAQEESAFMKIKTIEDENKKTVFSNTELPTTGSTTPAVSQEDKEFFTKNVTLAIENYGEYLSRKPDAKDKDKINSRIEQLNDELKKYNTQSEAQPKSDGVQAGASGR